MMKNYHIKLIFLSIGLTFWFVTCSQKSQIISNLNSKRVMELNANLDTLFEAAIQIDNWKKVLNISKKIKSLEDKGNNKILWKESIGLYQFSFTPHPNKHDKDARTHSNKRENVNSKPKHQRHHKRITINLKRNKHLVAKTTLFFERMKEHTILKWHSKKENGGLTDQIETLINVVLLPLTENKKIILDQEFLEKNLSTLQYYVTQSQGTERPFTGSLYNNKKSGKYHCIVCKSLLFSSKHKYTSGTGWPSFYMPVNSHIVDEKTDFSYGVVRTEIRCNICDSHLGHIFNDGPEPTRLRYCINSASLIFKLNEEK